MSRRILVVAAHTDDETLGCGGTIKRHSDAGDIVSAIHLTDGVASRDLTDAEDSAKRSEAAEEAATALGFNWLAGASFPDNALDSVPLLEVVKFIESIKIQFQPDMVYTHHGGDLNVDHRIAFQATLTAFRPQPGESLSEIRTFEVASSTEWSTSSIGPDYAPNLFIDISDFWEAKVAALSAYEEEIRDFPHSRSIKAIDALSTWRGNQVGLHRAEAFEIIRKIEH